MLSSEPYEEDKKLLLLNHNESSSSNMDKVITKLNISSVDRFFIIIKNFFYLILFFSS